MNPNKAFKDKHKQDPMAGFRYLLFMAEQQVRLTCSHCGWEMDFTVDKDQRFYYTTVECENCDSRHWSWHPLNTGGGG